MFHSKIEPNSEQSIIPTRVKGSPVSARALQINLRINYPVILIAVLLVHLFCLTLKDQSFLTALFQPAPEAEREAPTPLKIRSIRTVGSRESKVRDSVYLSKNEHKSKTITKSTPAPTPVKANSLSLSQLSAASAPKVTYQRQTEQTQRPGSRPEAPRPKALTGIGLKGSEMKNFAQNGIGTPAGDQTSATLSNTDVAVNLEVPEGVNPDELNKYELMFYGFQRRTAIGYVNAFYKRLDKFQRENPHKTFPLTETKQVMTGRLTYDEHGNIKQIKMIRWSNIDKLQDFFVDVVKEMDRLPNPPTALWQKTGEFSIYFSFVVNG